ncbi:RNA polymerase sigma factor [Shigella sonnei]|nr:RNA polymerase sigma factor [Shigella sonnei]
MSQNTLKVHDLNEDAEFDENGVEVFDEKALVEEEPSDNDLAEEELLSQGATQRVLDATQLYLGEIGSTVNGRRRSLFCASRTAWRCRLSPPDDRE